MKNSIMAMACMVLFACNNEGGNSTGNGDTTGHSTHAITDTTVEGGNSMMELMERNMEQMRGMQSTGNPDQDFAAMMKVHHMGAVEMAQQVIAKGSDTAVIGMARMMVSEQQREINELDAFLTRGDTSGKKAAGGDAFYKASMQQMSSMKMDMDHSGPVDRQFVQMMIPHHQHGIDMARSYLQNGARDPKLKAMANNIISSQQKEITQMQQWRGRN